jgi:hypothetical protein
MSEGRRHADHTFTLWLSRSRSGGEGRASPPGKGTEGASGPGRTTHGSGVETAHRTLPPRSRWRPMEGARGIAGRRREATDGNLLGGPEARPATGLRVPSSGTPLRGAAAGMLLLWAQIS